MTKEERTYKNQCKAYNEGLRIAIEANEKDMLNHQDSVVYHKRQVRHNLFLIKATKKALVEGMKNFNSVK